MTTKIEALKNIFVAASENEGIVKAQAQAMLESADNDADKLENKKLMQRAATHEKYNAALAGMSDKAMQQALKYKVDAQALANQARELKKRSIAILEALASEARCKDKALDAIMQRLAAKRDDKLTIAQIQREMQHETNTQAGYFKTCAVFYKFAQYSSANKEVIFDYDNALFKALLAIYTA